MTGTSVIDLGVIGPDEGGYDDERGDRRPLRGWLVAALLVVVGSLAGAAPVSLEPQQITRRDLGAGRYAVVGDTLYTLPARGGGTAAIDLRTGAPRWTLGADNAFGRVDEVGDLAILGSDRCNSTGGTGMTMAVEAATGEHRWRRSGVPVDLVDPTGVDGGPAGPGAGAGGNRMVIVLLRASWGDRCGNAVDGPPRTARQVSGQVRIDGVDALTGTVRWTRIIRAGSRLLVGGAAGHGWMVVDDAVEDRITSVDFVTGRTAEPVPRAEVGRLASVDDRLAAVGDLLVLPERVAAGTLITGYDRTTLARRWSTSVPVGSGGSAELFVAHEPIACGALVCVVGVETTALDPATGQVRWRTGRDRYVAVPGALLVDVSWSPGTASAVDVRVNDPETGRPLVTHRTWRLLNGEVLDGAGATGLTTGAAGTDAPIIGLADDEVTHLAWLGEGGTTLRPIGTVDDRYTSCRATDRYLACLTHFEELRVWRLRR